jgi:UDP-glucuronate decarboxylase
MKKILVTGGAGFIGSNLCGKLLSQGHRVVCLDNFSSGRPENVAHLSGNPAFKLEEHDVTEPFYVVADEIYNLACPASPPFYQRDPIQTTKSSVLGAINMLDLATVTGARILQASTSEIYGDPLVHPQVEAYFGNVNTTGPRACYDEGKRCAETLFMDYHRQRGTDIKIVRIFNTYGERMLPDDGRVVTNFIMQALRGENITIYGTGNQTRSFMYVDDLVEGLIRMMATEWGFTGPVNLGNPVETTIGALAETIIEMCGSTSGIVYRPLPTDDPCRRKPDITLALEILGWMPKTDLREGLARTIAYLKHCAPRILRYYSIHEANAKYAL